MVLDPQLLAEIFECFVIKLLSTIGNKDFRDPKATENSLRNLSYRIAIGKGPMMSSPHWAKGYGAFIGVSCSDGWRTILLKC